MTLNQCRYFTELAETGHFGRAAERLNMSQPPLSRQIAALEEELGVALFERGPRGVTLTPAGRQFREDAAAVLRLVDQARRNARAANIGEAGQLSLGFTMCAAYSVVPALTRTYREACPLVDLRVREVLPGEIEDELEDGRIDLAISFPGMEAHRFQTRALLREPLSLVLPQGHRLARSRRIRVEELAEESFLIVPRAQAPILYDSIVGRCQAAGFTPRVALEVYLQQTIINFVAEGLGIALVPASMRRSEIRGAVFKDVAQPPTIDQLLFWSTGNKNPCVASFLKSCEAWSSAAP